jgi:hypothetical protein
VEFAIPPYYPYQFAIENQPQQPITQLNPIKSIIPEYLPAWLDFEHSNKGNLLAAHLNKTNLNRSNYKF